MLSDELSMVESMENLIQILSIKSSKSSKTMWIFSHAGDMLNIDRSSKTNK